MKEYKQKETIDKILNDWVNPYFHKDNPVKVFYNINELFGWRFFLKAIRNKDWKSIKVYLFGRIWK